MQENFNKTGKQNFNKEYQGLKLKQNNIYMNQAQQKGLRGGHVQLDGDELNFNPLIGEEQKSKTSNMTEILSQVNKKSKSTKNHVNKAGLFQHDHHN